MKQKSYTVGLSSLMITILCFVFCFWRFGFYYETTESMLVFHTSGMISDPDTPFWIDGHFILLNIFPILQRAFPTIPIWGIYNCIILFVPFYIFIYFILNKSYHQWPNKAIILIITLLLLSDHLIHINNARIGVLYFSSYFILFIKARNQKQFTFSLLILILACLIRVEFIPLFLSLLISYTILSSRKVERFRLITTIVISLSIYSLFFWVKSYEDNYLKTIWDYERSILDLNNLKEIDSSSVDFQGQKAYQQLMALFFEDRAHITLEDFHNQLKYTSFTKIDFNGSWFKNYYNNITQTFNELKWNNFYLFSIICILLIMPVPRTLRKILLGAILLFFPFVIMTQSIMPARFLIPYIHSIAILIIILNRAPYHSIRWIITIIFIPCFYFSFIVHETLQKEKFQREHLQFLKLNQVFTNLNQSNITPIISTTFFSFYPSSYPFESYKKPKIYLANFGFYLYYETFRKKQAEYFHNQTDLFAVVSQVANDSNAIWVSNDYINGLLVDYFHYTRGINIIFKKKQEPMEGIGLYSILIDEK